MHIFTLQVTEPYKNRRQVELFFLIAQPTPCKKNCTLNKILFDTVYAAICTCYLIAIVQHDMQFNRSPYVLQINHID